MRSIRGCARCYGYIFKENSEKSTVNFSQNFRKELQYLEEIPDRVSYLMAQIANQKKTKLINYFDLVWNKNPQF